MAIQDNILPYEILARFDHTGALKGAHFINQRVISAGAEILSVKIGDAQAIDRLQGADRAIVADFMGEQATLEMSQISGLMRQVADLQVLADQVPTLTEALAAANAELSYLRMAAAPHIPTPPPPEEA